MTQQINFGIIGAGRIGRVHAESLGLRIPSANVLAVSDLFVDAAQRCAADFQIPVAAQDHRRILDDREIDAVVICSSTDTHTQMIVEAAQAGKQIFCEKPIALDLQQIDYALAAVKNANVKLQIGFNRRFDSNFQQIYESVRSGSIGTPHLLHITSRDPAPPPISYIERSGGIFLDMTIHDFDMARYLMGEEVTEVFASGGVLIDSAIGEAGDIDTALITLRFASGALGIINNSRQAVYGYDQRAEIFGSEGAIESANLTPSRTKLSTADGVASPNPLHFFLERYMDSYVAEMHSFIQAILDDTEPTVTGQDGRIPVVMGMAAGLSYRENRPVRLDEIG